MRARTREVNIFNMSLLDILCGALGAFCFMMLVLFPSYENKLKAGGNDTAALEDELRRTQAELERAREAASKGQSGDAQQTMQKLKQAEDSWHKAEARAREAEGKLQKARAEARQAQEQADQATGRAEAAKRPLVVEAMWSNPADEVNIYIRFLGKSAKGTVAPAFDPNVRPQATYTGDSWFAWSGHEMWLLRDTPIGEYEVYYRLAKRADPRPVLVNGVYASEGVIVRLPQINFDASRNGALVGTLVRRPDGKIEFKPAEGAR